MSHFSVMVLGDYPMDALEPYAEYDGSWNEYVVEVDCTNEIREEFREYAEDGQSLKEFLESRGLEVLPTEVDPDHYALGTPYAVVDRGEIIKAARYTNPNGKWDWYVLGGRWAGFLKLKKGATALENGRIETVPEGYADSALKCDIDFAGMRKSARNKAARLWDKVHAILDAHPGTKPFRTIREGYPDTEKGMDAARVKYNSQPGVIALKEAGCLSFFGDAVADFAISRDEYMKRAALRACAPYAWIGEDGGWHGKGEMGWFGISYNEVDEDPWLQEFNDMLDSLPGDTRISVYDCHT